MDKANSAADLPSSKLLQKKQGQLPEKHLGETKSPAGEEDCNATIMGPTREALVEEMEGLKAVAEAKRKSVEMLKVKVRKLNNSLLTANQMFQGSWRTSLRKWRREDELSEIRRKGDLLERTVETLKMTLAEKTSGAGDKMEEIRMLTAKLEALKWEKGNDMALRKVEKVGQVSLGKPVVKILNEQIWNMILGKWSDPKDSWINSSLFFDNVLPQWKSGWLLEQALPFLYPYLPGNKIMECRLISQSWKRAVDNFLEGHPSVRPHNPEKYDFRTVNFVYPMMGKDLGRNYVIRFSSKTDMTTYDDPCFLEKWRDCQIIGRSITLYLGRYYPHDNEGDQEAVRRNENEGFQQMWDKFKQFLSFFGDQIWYMNILYWINNGDEWEKKLLPFLTWGQFKIFPNLRKLRIGHFLVSFPVGIHPDALPPAPALETFEADLFENGDPISISMLLRHHNQLRKLALSVKNWRHVNPLDWPNLTELQLTWFEDENDFSNLCAGVGMPKLTKLVIGVSVDFQTRITIQTMCRVLHDFSASTPLNTLRLVGGLRDFSLVIGRGIDESCYQLSNVKTLEFDHSSGDGFAPTYDFLLYLFPLLEVLNVFVPNRIGTGITDCFLRNEVGLLPLDECERAKNPPQLGKEPEIVEVNKYIYTGEMYKSNIWELMPKLKIFSFQWDIFTREGFEAYKEKLPK